MPPDDLYTVLLPGEEQVGVALKRVGTGLFRCQDGQFTGAAPPVHIAGVQVIPQRLIQSEHPVRPINGYSGR